MVEGRGQIREEGLGGGVGGGGRVAAHFLGLCLRLRAQTTVGTALAPPGALTPPGALEESTLIVSLFF